MRISLLPGEREAFRTRLHSVVLATPIVATVSALLIIWYGSTGFTADGTPSILAVVITLLLGLACVGLALWTQSSAHFVVTNKRVLLRAGLFVSTTSEILLAKVEMLELEQGPLGSVLGYGTVVVGGTGNTKRRFAFVRSAEKFRDIVRRAVESSQKPESAKAGVIP